MARGAVSNPLALAVLACLTEKPMHPYEMAASMRERGKQESIKLTYGSLYTVVDMLERHGMIAPRETVREGRRPERTVYEITDAGRLTFADSLGGLIATPVKEYPAFGAALALMGALPPGEPVRLLEQRTAHLRAKLERARAGAGPSGHQEDYRVAMLATELEWVATLARSLSDESPTR